MARVQWLCYLLIATLILTSSVLPAWHARQHGEHITHGGPCGHLVHSVSSTHKQTNLRGELSSNTGSCAGGQVRSGHACTEAHKGQAKGCKHRHSWGTPTYHSSKSDRSSATAINSSSLTGAGSPTDLHIPSHGPGETDESGDPCTICIVLALCNVNISWQPSGPIVLCESAHQIFVASNVKAVQLAPRWSEPSTGPPARA